MVIEKAVAYCSKIFSFQPFCLFRKLLAGFSIVTKCFSKNHMEEEIVSTVQNSGTDAIAEDSDSNSRNNPCSLNKQRRDDLTVSSPRFKGVVSQQNGNWGAQIYTEKAVAMVYDSVAIKLRREEPHRNFPMTNVTNLEPTFQGLHTTGTILNMIKDGSYNSKFMDFINSQSMVIGNDVRGRLNDREMLCQHLFHKELTLSDVGKLNRLVIPKKHAVKFFPLVPDMDIEGDEDKGKVEAIQVTIFDRQLKSWKFRYCYWSSSQSYVFVKGWNHFVKDKELKANDVITFYKCQYIEDIEEQTMFYMIDIHHKSGETSGHFFDARMEQHLDLRGHNEHDSEGEKRERRRVLGYLVLKSSSNDMERMDIGLRVTDLGI